MEKSWKNYGIVFLNFCGNPGLINTFAIHYLESSCQTWYMQFFNTLQGLHRLEKYLNMKNFREKSLKIKYALKSTGESLKGLEKCLNFTLFCNTYTC